MPKMYGWVREVVPESPADLAGLQPGDLIRTINGTSFVTWSIIVSTLLMKS